MNGWWSRLIILGLLALVLGVPFALSFAQREVPLKLPADAPRLVIFTPHSEQIRYEVAQAFNAWRAARGQPLVQFEWRTGGGTTDLRKQVLAEFEANVRKGTEEQGAYDLFFGGGEYEHNKLAQGVKTQRDGRTVSIPAIVPVDIPADLLQEVFPEPTIGGERLYHPDLMWVGVVLSSFGIVYNRDTLDLLRLDREPVTWSDLADPGYLGWIALADPAHSGSIAAAYSIMLRRLGWTEGWGALRRVFANARYFTASAGKVPVDVSAGEAAAGMCIDFYGRYQAGAVRKAGGDRVGYVDPPRMTAITADPISILRGAPNRELANEFVLWLLSPQAQMLWQRRLDLPEGAEDGPRRFELRRLPIRRDVYDSPVMAAQWTDQVNPFEIAKPLPKAMPDFYMAVAPVAHALAIDIHDDLQAAWRAILAGRNDPDRARMLELFDALPADLTLRWPDRELEARWLAILEDPQAPRHEEVAAVLAGFADQVLKFSPDHQARADRFRQTWADVLGDPAHPRYSEVSQVLAELDAAATDPAWNAGDALLRARLRWTAFFRGHYRRIVDLADN